MTNFINLKNTLKSRLPCFCLYGNDRWLQRRAVENICQAYGIDAAYGTERPEPQTYGKIEECCCTPALFGGTKLVLCENFVFPQGKQGLEVTSNLGRLLDSCDGSFCLVFVSPSAEGFDKVRNVELVCCDKLDYTSVTKWIVAYAKKQGVAVDMFCARKICEYCLGDMSRVETETQKLLDYGHVTTEAVEALVHKDVEYVVFNLTKTIASRNAGAALELYRGLVAAGEQPRGLFGLMYNFYRRAYYVKITQASTEQLAQMLLVKPFAVDRAKETAAKYKPMQLKRMLDNFSQADLLLRSFADEDEVMTTLIMRLCAA